MKKNLFLLLSFYCFVIQPSIAGILRDDVNFFYLWGINVVIIALITALYFSAHQDPRFKKIKRHNSVVHKTESIIHVQNDKDKKEEIKEKVEEEIKEEVKKEETKKENNEEKKQKKAKKKIDAKKYLLALVFVVILLWMGVTTLYLHQMFNWELSVLLAVVSGYLWFVILCSLFALKVKNWFFKGFRYLLLAGAVALLSLLVYADLKSPGSYIKDFWNQVFSHATEFFEKFQSEKEKPPLVEESGKIVDVVINEAKTWVNLSGAILSGVSLSWEKKIMTGEVIMTGNIKTQVDTKNEEKKEDSPFPELNADTELTMLQAITYLLEKNKVVLDKKQSIPFSYVDYDSENYPYFKTAYRKGLIGKNTKPDAIISCDIFVVMQGLLEWWNVKRWNNIKQAYWDKAKKLDKLSTCQQGKKLTVADL